MADVRLGVCGLGTVATGLIEVLGRNGALINARAGRDVTVSHVGARRDNPACTLPVSVTLSRDIFAVADDPAVDILVELIGGTDTARELVLKAIANGKHIVTANKALIAEHGNEIFAAAREQGVQVAFEAAVAGGIPIIKALREGLSGNEVRWLAGIINGTGNFILTEMKDKARDFADVLAEAQQLGYAEADPTFDVEGIDAAHKLAILASIAFGMPLQFDKTYTEGISTLEVEDLNFAEELGYRIKHLGIARHTTNGIELRVHPTLIPAQRLLANVDGVMNAVLVASDAAGPTMYYGAGAGGEATASAVLADIVDLARAIDAQAGQRVAPLSVAQDALHAAAIVAIEHIHSAYYLRMKVEDKPGVLAHVSGLFSDAGISIEALIQKEPRAGEASAQIILLTEVVEEKVLNAAMAKLQSLSEVIAPVVRIRAESLSA